MTRPRPVLRRRDALLGLTCAVGLGTSALAVGPAATPHQGQNRLVVVILRGALDGMAAVTPYGDPDLAALRGALLLPEPGRPGGLLELGGFYGLHPALAGLHRLYRAGALLPFHAVVGPTHSRSHFDAQDDLERGTTQRLESGWLNRAAMLLPQRTGHKQAAAMAIGSGAMPLILRGPAPATSWSPEAMQSPLPDLYARIAELNRTDRVLGPAIQEGLRTRLLAEAVLGDTTAMPATGGRGSFPTLAHAAGELLADDDGPRIAALEIGGWDTHAAQTQRVVAPLSQLDQGMLALQAALGPAWARTAVLVMTEFGRTARVNGTGGTDHGTATVALLLGGTIKGGRVGGTWPSLSATKLFENRDLAPTTDIRSLAKGMLADHMGLSQTALARIFPDSPSLGPQSGLV